jgi:DNA-binding SARP family transcriptional activator/predicted ATPase
MEELKLQFLGEIRVLRGAQELALPPSKKTRGLLAYMALNQRSFRREQLCELLWEIPDDPRGSLRWSLSKLRRLVDDDRQTRIVANRTHASFEPGDAHIDVLKLMELTRADLKTVPIAELRSAAEQHKGEFLEGLELPNFHEFYTWHIGQRQQVNRAQAQLNAALVERLRDRPEQALPYAQTLCTLTPFEKNAHLEVIQLLQMAGRTQEAEQQLKLAEHLLKEAGVDPGDDLRRASHPLPAQTTATQGETAPPLQASRKEGIRFARDKIYGRDEEIAQLIGIFNEVSQTPQARLILLRGEPGIGKSRLLQLGREMAVQVDTLLLSADAFESEIIRPFALWKDAFRRANSIAGPEILDVDKPADRDHLFAGLSEFIRNESGNRPMCLIFDDLQWCDESSAAALHYVLRMNRDRPLYVLAGARQAELRDNAPMQQTLRGLRHEGLIQEFTLEPLAAEAVSQLVSDEAPQADVQRLCEESRGNPLMAIELARAELSGGSSGSLADLVQERLARLGADGAELVMWASVMAPNIDARALQNLSGLGPEQTDAALQAAQDQSMLVTAERGYRFTHDMICSSVYRAIPSSRRSAMHCQIARQLEVDSALDLQLSADLAHHATKSGDPALAARAMVSAARLCLRFYANEDALNLALTGLEFTEQLPESERVCLALELSDIRVAAAPIHDWESAAREFVDLAELALDHGALPHARLGYHLASHLRWIHGDWAVAQRDTLQAERVTRGASDEEHIIGMAQTAKCLALLERDLPRADALLMEADALAQRNRVHTTAIPGASGILRYYEGQLELAEELLQEARTACKAQGERINEYQANEYLLMIAIERDDLETAQQHCSALLSIGEKLPEGSELPFAQTVQVVLDYAGKQQAEGLDDVLRALREVDAKHRLSYALNRIAILDVDCGEFEDAVFHASEALACTELLGRDSEKMLAITTLAQAYFALGRNSQYEEQMAAIKAMLPSGVAQWARARAESFLALQKENNRG